MDQLRRSRLTLAPKPLLVATIASLLVWACGAGSSETRDSSGSPDASAEAAVESIADKPDAGGDSSTLEASSSDASLDANIDALFDASSPAQDVLGLSFTDTAPQCPSLGGNVVIKRAVDESHVISYALYWGSSPTTKVNATPIVVLAKTGADIVYSLAATAVPPQGNYILAFSVTTSGERATGAAVRATDALAMSNVNVSTGLPGGIGAKPRILIDESAQKVLIVSEDDANPMGNLLMPALFRCDLDGSNCAYTDISAGEGAQSASWPAPVLDVAGGKLLVVAAHKSHALALYRCNADGSSCTHTDISAGQSLPSGYFPSPVIDTAAGKLLVATQNGANGGRPGLFRCALDGSACTYTDISAGQGTYSGKAPTALIDTANQKLLVVTEDGLVNPKPGLFRCDLDGTNCAFVDISAGQPAGVGLAPSATIDPFGNKLVVATTDITHNQALALFRCDLDGTACVYVSLSELLGSAYTAIGPSVHIDTYRHEIVVSTLIETTPFDSTTITVASVRCDLDLSGCTRSDITGGQPAMGISDSSGTVSASGNVFVATNNHAKGVRGGLLDLYLACGR